jgi:hypothetical protein
MPTLRGDSTDSPTLPRAAPRGRFALEPVANVASVEEIVSPLAQGRRGGHVPRVRRLVAVIAAVLPVLCAATFVAQASAGMPRRCATLRGRRLLATPAVKVVERVGERSGVVYACAPPRGRVRLAGAAYDAIADGEPRDGTGFAYSVDVVADAGSWVAMSFTSTVDFHGRVLVEKVIDARSGRSYRFFETGLPEGPGFEEGPIGGQLERVQLNRVGELAFALITDGRTEIVAVSAGGVQQTLDSAPSAQIPTASLVLAGNTIRWVDGGATRSASL